MTITFTSEPIAAHYHQLFENIDQLVHTYTEYASKREKGAVDHEPKTFEDAFYFIHHRTDLLEVEVDNLKVSAHNPEHADELDAVNDYMLGCMICIITLAQLKWRYQRLLK